MGPGWKRVGLVSLPGKRLYSALEVYSTRQKRGASRPRDFVLEASPRVGQLSRRAVASETEAKRAARAAAAAARAEREARDAAAAAVRHARDALRASAAAVRAEQEARDAAAAAVRDARDALRAARRSLDATVAMARDEAGRRRILPIVAKFPERWDRGTGTWVEVR
jgi:hypothetical protein